MTQKTLTTPVNTPLLDEINEPARNDVISGRGGRTNLHEGNIRFRNFINQLRPKYKAARKTSKPFISLRVVNYIRSLDPPGRFLTQDKKSGLWIEIGDKKAREKVSQAMRDKPALHFSHILLSKSEEMSNCHLGGDLNTPIALKPIPSSTFGMVSSVSDVMKFQEQTKNGGSVDTPSLVSSSDTKEAEHELKNHVYFPPKKHKLPESIINPKVSNVKNGFIKNANDSLELKNYNPGKHVLHNSLDSGCHSHSIDMASDGVYFQSAPSEDNSNDPLICPFLLPEICPYESLHIDKGVFSDNKCFIEDDICEDIIQFAKKSSNSSLSLFDLPDLCALGDKSSFEL